MIRRCSVFSSSSFCRALYLISSVQCTCKRYCFCSFTSFTFKFWTRFFECCFSVLFCLFAVLRCCCFCFFAKFLFIFFSSVSMLLLLSSLLLKRAKVYFNLLLCLAVFPMRFVPMNLFSPVVEALCAHTSSSRMRFIWEHVLWPFVTEPKLKLVGFHRTVSRLCSIYLLICNCFSFCSLCSFHRAVSHSRTHADIRTPRCHLCEALWKCLCKWHAYNAMSTFHLSSISI